MIKAITLIIVVMTFVQGKEVCSYFVNPVNEVQIKYLRQFDYKFLKITELKAQAPDKGFFETTGFVVKKYVCPPCPPNAQCKPCMKDNIVISENNKKLETYNLTDRELIIFADNEKTEHLVANRLYRFSIEVTNSKTSNEPLNDIELLNYRTLK